ncbi:MAG: hypothetical protein JKY33_05315, partial [Bacteroidia bacterium]|nr:hypothetical protein [Bacteroidia bacterium]
MGSKYFKTFLFGVICLLLINNYQLSFAQQSKVDSLKAELKKELSDTTRIKALNDLGWEIKYQTPDTAILLGKQALKLSESVMLSGVKGWQKGIANSYSNLGVHYKNKGDYTLSLSCH